MTDRRALADTDRRLLALLDSASWRRASQGAIARRLGVSRRTIIRAVARLSRAGLIEVRPHRRADGGTAPARYRIAPHATASPATMVARVVEIVAGAVGVRPQEVLASRARRKEVALARQVAMYLAAVDLELSHDAVAGAFRRDRTTVGYALGRIEDRRDDRAFETAIAGLEAAVVTAFRPAPPLAW